MLHLLHCIAQWFVIRFVSGALGLPLLWPILSRCFTPTAAPRERVLGRALAIHYFTVLIIIFPLLRVGLSFRYIVCCFLVWLMANARFFLLILIANWSFGVKVLDRDERNSSRRVSCVIVRGRLSSGAKTTSFYGRSPFDQTIAGVLIDVLRSDFKIKFFFLRGSTPLQLSQRIDFVNRDRIVWVGSSFQEICTKFPFHPRLAVLVSSKKWNKSFCASKNACCARKNTWKYQQEGKKRAKRSNQSREKKRKINKKKIPTT